MTAPCLAHLMPILAHLMPILGAVAAGLLVMGIIR